VRQACFLGDSVFPAAIPVSLKPVVYALLCYKLSCSTVPASTKTQGYRMNGAFTPARSQTSEKAVQERAWRSMQKSGIFDVKNGYSEAKMAFFGQKSAKIEDLALPVC
jgi:hypothetical protein